MTDTECRNVTVTRTRKMINRKCKTKRCELLTKIVEEKAFNEDIKHVCEEHIKVTVDIPFPVKVPHPAVYEPDTNHVHLFLEPQGNQKHMTILTNQQTSTLTLMEY